MMAAMLLVGLGGALGAMTRFGVSNLLPRTSFPWATAVVNLAGSFILGFVALPGDLAPGPRLFFAVGFLGAFTTLSAFSIETVELIRLERLPAAAASMLINTIGGPLLAFLGWRLAS